jgi:hypothetical protein
LSKNYGSDKGSPVNDDIFKSGSIRWKYHRYTDFYEHFFGPWRHSVKSLFECGIGTNNPDIDSSMGVAGNPGASLRLWESVFPNALIYGADIDKNILFDEGRIQTFYVDQTDPISVEALSKTLPKGLDIIIDDGLHTAEAAVSLFKGIYNNLRPGGVYVIEDVWKNLKKDMKAELEEEMEKLNVPYSIVSFAEEVFESSLMVIFKPVD